MQITGVKSLSLGLALVLLAGLIWFLSRQPSNQRDWTRDQAILARARFNGDRIRVKNIRNANYQSVTEYAVNYYARTLDPKQVTSVWMMLEPFGAWEGMAHVLLSFGLSDQTYLAVSIEIRKKKGQSFSPWKGLWKQYELMYVLGDERDLIRLRSNVRHDRVYLFPLKMPPDKMQALLTDMLQRADQLAEKPEFYNTLGNTCATNILWHFNRIWPGRMPWNWRIAAPGYLDRYLYDLGLLDTNLPYPAIRKHFQINAAAQANDQAPDFSLRIRAPAKIEQ